MPSMRGRASSKRADPSAIAEIKTLRAPGGPRHAEVRELTRHDAARARHGEERRASPPRSGARGLSRDEWGSPRKRVASTLRAPQAVFDPQYR